MSERRNNFGLKSVLNFRDAGGLKTCDGMIMRKGIIYRSASLDRIKRKDIERLHQLGIKTIFDLRASGEYQKRKVKISDVNLISLPLDFEEVTRERLRPLIIAGNQEEAVQRVINDLYREILDSARPVIKVIAETILKDGHIPLIIHCRAGKDRTGIICALLQMIAGCCRDEITDNYMKSNDYLLPHFRKILKLRKYISFGFFPADAILDAITLRKENIELVIERVENHYHGIRGYLSESGFDMKLYGDFKSMLIEIDN